MRYYQQLYKLTRVIDVSTVVTSAIGISHDVAAVEEPPLTAHILAYHELICGNNQVIIVKTLIFCIQL